MNQLLNKLSKITGARLPKIAVFDLDHTCWPFAVDSYQYVPPYHFYQGKLVDNNNQEIKSYPDFPKIFQMLQSNSIKVAVASRTTYPSGAYRLLDLLDWNKYINYYQIYPGKKTKHFQKIKEESGFDYQEMIFFDDEERNIVDVGALGVYAVYVDPYTGATESIVLESLEKFATQKTK